jgi:hypothetical protein
MGVRLDDEEASTLHALKNRSVEPGGSNKICLMGLVATVRAMCLYAQYRHALVVFSVLSKYFGILVERLVASWAREDALPIHPVPFT